MDTFRLSEKDRITLANNDRILIEDASDSYKTMYTTPEDINVYGSTITPIESIIYVSKNGNDSNTGTISDPFLTIQSGINYITDNSFDKRYAIVVGPGIYEEDNPIQMKEYVSVTSAGGSTSTKIVAKNHDQSIFLGVKDALIKDVELACVSSASAIYCTFSGSVAYKDIIFTDCQRGIRVDNAGAEISAYNLSFTTTTGTFDEGVLVESGKLDIRDLVVIQQAYITTLVKSTGADSSIDIWNLQTESPNITNGVYAINGGKVTIISSDVGYTTNALRVEQDSYICARNALVYNSETYDLWMSGNGEYGGHGTGVNRDMVYDQDGTGILHSFGCDPGRKIFRTLADYSVGMPFQGRCTCLGEGGSYADGVKILTFDGSSYVDVTDSDTIEFPNTTTGTCFYFGETNKNYWYGLEYIQGDTTISGGDIEWQYYDGGTGWTKVNTLNTILGYSDSYNGSSFIGDDEVEQAIRFDSNMKTGIIESDNGATGWTNNTVDGDEAKWIRCMITSNIGRSPKFSDVKMKGSFITFRANGTCTYNGEARSLAQDALSFGDCTSGANKPLDVSANITYPYESNSLANTSQQLYFRFIIDENVDTSCGLNLYITISSPFTDAGDASCTINVHTSSVSKGGYFDGANTEVLQVGTFTYTGGDLANKLHIKTLPHRIDISELETGDIVYICIRRMAGATMTGSLDFSNVSFVYRKWQEGQHFIN